MKLFTTTATIVTVLLLAGCGDSHEAVVDDMIDEMNDLLSVLDGINSPADATAAKPKLQAIAENLKGIKKRADGMGDPSKEVQEKIMGKMKTAAGQWTSKLIAFEQRMQANPEIRQELQGVMEEVEKVIR